MSNHNQSDGVIAKRLLAWVSIFIVIAIVVSFAPQEQKKYRIDLTLDEINNTIYSLENSSAPHNIVVPLIKNIADQANKQLAVEKQISDSSSKKKNQ